MELEKDNNSATAKYECSSEGFRCICHVKVTKAGIKITAQKGFDEHVPFSPGEELVFIRKAENFQEALKIAEQLPQIAPEDMERHSFIKTSQILYN